jgi:hypothetical protein
MEPLKDQKMFSGNEESQPVLIKKRQKEKNRKTELVKAQKNPRCRSNGDIKS